MTSIICPKCKGHISEWDVICLNCGHTVSPEERKVLVKEHEEIMAHEHELKMAAHQAHLKHHHSHNLQMRLDKFSVGVFHTTFDVVTVFLISVLLLIITAWLMMMS
jgi:uncharacterized Zn finger protein (UPF0148 family)